MRTSLPSGRERAIVASGLGGLAAVVGLACGWATPLLLSTVLGLSGLVWVLVGWFPVRGVVAGGIALLLGSATVDPSAAPAALAWGDVALLGALLPVALLGARKAEALRASLMSATLAPDDGRWAQIVVEGSGPAPGVGRLVPLPTVPPGNPERRRLSRRAERRGELVASMADE